MARQAPANLDEPSLNTCQEPVALRLFRGPDLFEHHRRQWEQPATISDDVAGERGRNGEDYLRLDGESAIEPANRASCVNPAEPAGIGAILCFYHLLYSESAEVGVVVGPGESSEGIL